MSALDYDIVGDDLSAFGAGPALVTFGEVMVRDTPADDERLERARTVHVSMAGSEYTLAIALARLGVPVDPARVAELASGAVVTRPHIARALNLPGQDFDAVLSWILALRKKLGVPHTLGELGVEEAAARTIAADAVKDPTAGANPRQLTEAEFEQLTLAAIRGDLGS